MKGEHKSDTAIKQTTNISRVLVVYWVDNEAVQYTETVTGSHKTDNKNPLVRV